MYPSCLFPFYFCCPSLFDMQQNNKSIPFHHHKTRKESRNSYKNYCLLFVSISNKKPSHCIHAHIRIQPYLHNITLIHSYAEKKERSTKNIFFLSWKKNTFLFLLLLLSSTTIITYIWKKDQDYEMPIRRNEAHWTIVKTWAAYWADLLHMFILYSLPRIPNFQVRKRSHIHVRVKPDHHTRMLLLASCGLHLKNKYYNRLPISISSHPKSCGDVGFLVLVLSSCYIIWHKTWKPAEEYFILSKDTPPVK